VTTTTRHTALRLRVADSSQGIVEGVGATFGVPYGIDGGRKEILRSGAFTESITKGGGVVPVFWAHSWAKDNGAPIGVATVSTRDGQLHTRAQLFIDTNETARSVFEAAKAGALREFSVGFVTPNATDVRLNGDTDEVIRGDLLEVSVVMKGAGVTGVTSVREKPEPTPTPDPARVREVLARMNETKEQPPMTATKPSPSTLEAAIHARRASGGDGATLGERFVASSQYAKARRSPFITAEGSEVQVSSADELAARLRIVTADQLLPQSAPQWTLLPGSGGRVAPLVRTVSIDSGVRLHVANETARTTAAAPTAFGTALPLGSVSVSSAEASFHRIGAYLEATRGVIEDRGALRDVVDQYLMEDVQRAIDLDILLGDGTGENSVGLLNAGASVPTQALGTDGRFQAIIRAAAKVRAAGFTGPIDVVIEASTDAVSLLTEVDDTGEQTFDRDVLDALGVRSVVPSALVTQGKVIVGDLASASTLWVREGITIRMATQHNSNLTSGIVTLSAEARLEFEVVMPTAAVVVTGF
jgi:HK97 family phage prohead protease